MVDSAVKDVQKISLLHNGVIHPSDAPTATPVYAYLIVSYTVSSSSGVSASLLSYGLSNMTNNGELSEFLAESLPTMQTLEFGPSTGTVLYCTNRINTCMYMYIYIYTLS